MTEWSQVPAAARPLPEPVPDAAPKPTGVALVGGGPVAVADRHPDICSDRQDLCDASRRVLRYRHGVRRDLRCRARDHVLAE